MEKLSLQWLTTFPIMIADEVGIYGPSINWLTSSAPPYSVCTYVNQGWKTKQYLRKQNS